MSRLKTYRSDARNMDTVHTQALIQRVTYYIDVPLLIVMSFKATW